MVRVRCPGLSLEVWRFLLGLCLLFGLWESVVRLPSVMRVLLSGDVLVPSRFGASC